MLDDCSLRMAGTFCEVAHYLRRASRDFTVGLDEDMSCVLSRSKSGVLATSTKLLEVLVAIIETRELKPADEARNTGIGYGAVAGASAVAAKQLTKAIEQLTRISEVRGAHITSARNLAIFLDRASQCNNLSMHLFMMHRVSDIAEQRASTLAI
ncbi:unnamed protein product [Prorocentrum cordatum]|uniref:Uncharacterized protein n=1 Tax=Prorocentrum cordatum TaxID=2364126 RepID=A0ABN9XFE8_9DINO|nr:unnamed protein product [Polarella glacialis]